MFAFTERPLSSSIIRSSSYTRRAAIGNGVIVCSVCPQKSTRRGRRGTAGLLFSGMVLCLTARIHVYPGCVCNVRRGGCSCFLYLPQLKISYAHDGTMGFMAFRRHDPAILPPAYTTSPLLPGPLLPEFGVSCCNTTNARYDCSLYSMLHPH